MSIVAEDLKLEYPVDDALRIDIALAQERNRLEYGEYTDHRIDTLVSMRATIEYRMATTSLKHHPAEWRTALDEVNRLIGEWEMKIKLSQL